MWSLFLFHTPVERGFLRVYSAIIIAVVLIGFFIGTFIMKYVPRPWGPAISLLVSMVLVSPFLWAMGFKHTLAHTTEKLMDVNRFNKGLIRFVFVLRFVLVWIAAYAVIQHFLNGLFWEKLNIGSPWYTWINIAFALIYTVLLRVLSPAMKFYKHIEERFMDNLNKRQQVQVFEIPEILQENCHLQKMTLSPDSPYSGKHIRETDFRDNYNVSVVSVERGKQLVEVPKSDFQLFPFDKLTFVGHEDHLRLLLPKVELFEHEIASCRSVDG